jgi:hypothetical protein
VTPETGYFLTKSHQLLAEADADAMLSINLTNAAGATVRRLFRRPFDCTIKRHRPASMIVAKGLLPVVIDRFYPIDLLPRGEKRA